MKPMTRITTKVLAATLLASAFLTGCGRSPEQDVAQHPQKQNQAPVIQGSLQVNTNGLLTAWTVGNCARAKGQERIGTVTGGDVEAGTIEVVFVSDQVVVASFPEAALDQVVCAQTPFRPKP